MCTVPLCSSPRISEKTTLLPVGARLCLLWRQLLIPYGNRQNLNDNQIVTFGRWGLNDKKCLWKATPNMYE